MNKDILKRSVQNFIENNSITDLFEFVLKHKEIDGVPAQEIAEQIKSRNKALRKWPEWTSESGIFYPPSVSVEQSSSHLTAIFKSALTQYNTVLDLTGGAGIDSWYFSKKAKKVTYLERNAHLCEVFQHNITVLGAKNIEVRCGNAEEFLQQCDQYDLIYADPARRKGSSRKFLIQDCEPDIVSLYDVLINKGKTVMVKFSPLVDLHNTVMLLPSITEINVVSVNNEVKEVLVTMHKHTHKNINIRCSDHREGGWEQYSFTPEEEKECEINFSDPLRYVYEPKAAILKAGAFKSIAARYNCSKIAPNSHLYTNEELISDFPGRIWKYMGSIKARKKEVQKLLPEMNASVFTRNYPLKADVLKKKLGLRKDSEKFYLAGTTLKSGTKTLLLLERV